MTKAPSLKSRLVEAAGPQPARTTPVLSIAPEREPPAARSSAAKARIGKTMVAGHFSAEFARAVKLLAVEQGVTVQALIGEGLDELLRRHGKHPFGER